MSNVSGPPFVDMTTERSPEDIAELGSLLKSLLAASLPSGLSLAVVDSEGLLYSAYGGLACRVGTATPITKMTAYDLASLTKVVCSVTLTMVLATRGVLGLEDPVERWLPDFPPTGTTLLHLLTHTSGLVDHRPFFRYSQGRASIEAAVLEEAATSRPTGEVLYSDLNFMLTGWVLEACSSTPLSPLFEREVAAPLGMTRTRFRPPRDEDTAATELDSDERLTPGLVWGEVHDGNANALGGVSGHAGLFAPLSDLVAFVQELVAPSERVLTRSAVAAMTMKRAQTGSDIRGIGWRLSPEGWGDWPAGTFWHCGFTGTSLLVSPRANLGVVLLTNAIHPHRRLDALEAMRAEVHRTVAGMFLDRAERDRL